MSEALNVAHFATLLGKALAHPIRADIIARLGVKKRLSPSVAADAIGGELGVVSYHFRHLHSLGMLRAAGRVQRRGTVEHFYQLTPRGRRVLSVLETITANEA